MVRACLETALQNTPLLPLILPFLSMNFTFNRIPKRGKERKEKKRKKERKKEERKRVNRMELPNEKEYE